MLCVWCVGRACFSLSASRHQMLGDASNASIDTLLAAWYFEGAHRTILRTLLILILCVLLLKVIQNHYHIAGKKKDKKKRNKRTAHHCRRCMHAATQQQQGAIVVTLKTSSRGLCRKIWTCSFLTRTPKLALLRPNSIHGTAFFAARVEIQEGL